MKPVVKTWFRIGCFLVCLGLMGHEAQAETDSVMLVIRPVADDFFEEARTGPDPERKGDADERIVIGIIDAPELVIQDTNQVILLDPEGSPVPLTIETSSLYSEFDDEYYNSMRILFRVSERVLQQGALRLTWGDEVSANNTEVAQIPIYLEEQDRYRTFSWEALPEGDDGGSYAATLEVIVDDYADTYYLWYLLPMALIFVLLFVKKVALK